VFVSWQILELDVGIEVQAQIIKELDILHKVGVSSILLDILHKVGVSSILLDILHKVGVSSILLDILHKVGVSSILRLFMFTGTQITLSCDGITNYY